jgi:hypothetical protein
VLDVDITEDEVGGRDDDRVAAHSPVADEGAPVDQPGGEFGEHVPGDRVEQQGERSSPRACCNVFIVNLRSMVG